MQWHLGNTFIRINHTDTSESRDGGGITAASLPILGTGHYIRRTRIPLRKSKNTDSLHIAGGERDTICNARDTIRRPTQGPFVQHVTA